MGIDVAVILLLLIGTMISSLSVAFPTSLTLKRSLPMNPAHSLRLAQRDRARLQRISQSSNSSSNGIIGFPLNGTMDHLGLYYTTIRLGSPPKEFHVQIDTGSDMMWVSCDSCRGCPKFSIYPVTYDLRTSTTGSLVGCRDERCVLGSDSAPTYCSTQDHGCSYKVQYDSGDMVSGYYIEDLLNYEKIMMNSTSMETSRVVFGCSTEANVKSLNWMIDGFLGLSRNSRSIVSQLASSGVTRRAFSHCLRGDSIGGGFLVFGAIIDPNMTYIPMATGWFNYNVNLRSISVNNLSMPHNLPAVFDAGATALRIAEKAYQPFMDLVTATISEVATPTFVSPGHQCYSTASSVNVDIFPVITLDLDSPTFMVLSPQEYVFLYHSENDTSTWCLYILKGYDRTTLGDVVLRDKVVVYDITAERIGWVRADCSLPIDAYMIDTVITEDDKRGISVTKSSPWTLLFSVAFAFIFACVLLVRLLRR